MSIVGPRKYLKEIDCGTTVVYRHCPFEPPTEARIKRIDKEHYVVKSTAELRRYSPRSETKGDNLHSVRQSFNRLKSVINANVRGNDCVRFLTLTYAENMTDNARISSDLRQFFKRLRKMYGPMEYLYVKERQARRGVAHALRAVLRRPGPVHGEHRGRPPRARRLGPRLRQRPGVQRRHKQPRELPVRVSHRRRPAGKEGREARELPRAAYASTTARGAYPAGASRACPGRTTWST